MGGERGCAHDRDGERTQDRDAANLSALRAINASGHMTSLGGSTLSAGVVEDHRMGEGILAFDPRPLSDAEVDVVVGAVEAFFRA